MLRLLELLSLLAIFVQPSYALAVEGVIFDAEAPPGAKIAHEMTVSLGEDESSMDLVVEIDDWVQSEDGVNLPLEAGASPGPCSARGFLTAEPYRFHIDPGGTEGDGERVYPRGRRPRRQIRPDQHLQPSRKGEG